MVARSYVADTLNAANLGRTFTQTDVVAVRAPSQGARSCSFLPSLPPQPIPRRARRGCCVAPGAQQLGRGEEAQSGLRGRRFCKPLPAPLPLPPAQVSAMEGVGIAGGCDPAVSRFRAALPRIG
jgi:hypothetical protein